MNNAPEDGNFSHEDAAVTACAEQGVDATGRYDTAYFDDLDDEFDDLDDDDETDDIPERAAARPTKAAIFIAAMIIAGGAGAAAMSVRLSDRTSEPIIHYDPPATTAADTSTKAPQASSSSAVEAAVPSASTTAVPDSTSRTTVTVPEVSFTYPADINSASYECLASVSGINRTIADSIIKYREAHGRIHDLNELLDIFGVGERTLSVIKEHFYISTVDRLPAATTPPAVTSATEKTTTSKAMTSKTTTAKVQPTAPTETATATPEPVMRLVNINEATAEELAEGLLIDPEVARGIIELRENIGKFVNDLELLYVEGFSEEMLVERRDFICM